MHLTGTGSFPFSGQEPIHGCLTIVRNANQQIRTGDPAMLIPADVVLFSDANRPGEAGLGTIPAYLLDAMTHEII